MLRRISRRFRRSDPQYLQKRRSKRRPCRRRRQQMKNQRPQPQAQASNPMMDMFNQQPIGSAFRHLTAEQFREIEDSTPAMAPWLITNEFTAEFHIQTLLRTDCSHYFTLNAQTRNLLCRSYTDKISCPKHTGICFGCRRTVCTSGYPDGLPLRIEDGTTKWFCLDCHKPARRNLWWKRFFNNLLRGFMR